VAIFYNVPGVTKSLNLTGKVLEQIYLEGITMWNDPAIAALNPGVSLPNQQIVVIHRSDGSGTTYALTTYFSRIDPAWVKEVGVGTSVGWPNSPNPELAAKGSGGVAALVNGTTFSIGYADSYYAFANGLLTAAIQNSAGAFVKPSIAGAAAAAAADADLVQGNATYSITNAPGATSYPISTFTYLLVWASQSDPHKAEVITTFIWWIVHDGQSYCPKLFYAPLPAGVVTTDEGLIRQINYQGHSYAP
jgi:phosphate transport system substrate-binding protein